jgi:tetratricopeptide (TPR) repeat protein
MINKKIILLAGAILICAGCAGGSFKNYNDDEKSSGGQLNSEVEGIKTSSKKPAPSAPEKETITESSGALEDKFEAAVNSQREDQMLNAGSELLARNPENVKILAGFGVFYLKNNQPDAAKIYFDRVLAKDPKNADANNGMGVISMKENKEFEGQAYFKKALQGNDDHLGANANLGAFYLKYLDYDKALPLLENAYGQDRSNAAVANNYAIAVRGTGKIDKALSIYKSIDSKNQKVPVLLNQAILLAEFKKDSAGAKEFLNKIRFITTDPVILKKVNTLTLKLDQEVTK